MPYKSSQQLIDILLNAEFRHSSGRGVVQPEYKVLDKPLLYKSYLLYSFKLKHMLVNFNNSMITVSYNGKPVYRTEALSEDQLRSVIFYARLTKAERQKFITSKLDPFDMPAVIEKVDYFFNVVRKGNYFGYHELIAHYKRIELPPPLD